MYSSVVPKARAEYHPTFTTIFKRMKNHHIHLYKYIDRELKVYESKLDGISFKTKKSHALNFSDFLSALRAARKNTSSPASITVLPSGMIGASRRNMAATRALMCGMWERISCS